MVRVGLRPALFLFDIYTVFHYTVLQIVSYMEVMTMKTIYEAMNEIKAEVKRLRVNQIATGRLKKQDTAILVSKKLDGSGTVELHWSAEYNQMFGRAYSYTVELFAGDLETACKVARKAKADAKAVGANIRIAYGDDADFQLEMM